MAMNVEQLLADPDLARVADTLRALVRPGIGLTPSGADVLPPTASRLGGDPALPAEIFWPTAQLTVPPPSVGFRRAHPELPFLPPDGRIALPFVAQLWLPDFAPYDAAGLLPTTGLLSFFYNPIAYYSDSGDRNLIHDQLSGYAYGPYDYDNPANWRVLFHDVAAGEFVSAAPPVGLPGPVRYPMRALTCATLSTLPPIETAFIGEPDDPDSAVRLTREEWEIYAELWQETRGIGPRHQILGHQDNPQPYALEGAFRAARGIAADRAAERANLRLLLQIDDLGLPSFGRDGLLLFGIQSADLAACDFSNVWAVAP
jgi:uncharacterized protein YwqG